jgi:hypothetical protein
MKLPFIICFLAFITTEAISQNDPETCVLTSWFDSDVTHFNSYNVNNQTLTFIRVESGDTTQWHKHFYKDDLEYRSLSIIDVHSEPFDFLFFRNDLNQIIYRVNIIGGKNDTLFTPKRELETNEYGDELYHPLYKNLSYQYDSLGNRTEIIATDDEGELISSTILKYDSDNLLREEEKFEFDEKTLSNYAYNLERKLTLQVVQDEFGDTLSVSNHIYNESGFCIESSGVSYGGPWQMNFKIIECLK